MEFYEGLSGQGVANVRAPGANSSDVQRQLTNIILAQNNYLSMLKEEPLSAKYGSKDYLTQPGNARLDTAQDSERLLTCIDNEMQQPAFYDDNKYWLIDEVEKYMKANQEQIAEQRRIIAQQEEEER